jgi:hypothetical protein
MDTYLGTSTTGLSTPKERIMPEIEELDHIYNKAGIKGVGTMPRTLPTGAEVICIVPRDNLKFGEKYRVTTASYEMGCLFIRVNVEGTHMGIYNAARFAYNGYRMGLLPEDL